jgi:hypothetical protein
MREGIVCAYEDEYPERGGGKIIKEKENYGE